MSSFHKFILAVVVFLIFSASFAEEYNKYVCDEACLENKFCLFIGYITDIHHNDVGRRAGDSVEELKKVIEYFDTLPLAFIIHGGDFLDRNVEEAEKELQRVERAYQSGVHKGYHVLGNHDYDEPGGADITMETFISHTSLTEQYYHKDYGNIRFLFLNTNSEARDEAQFEWMENAITETDRHIIVFGHHPIAGQAGRISEIKEILERHRDQVVAAFTSHRSAVTNTLDISNDIKYYSMAHFFHKIPTYAVIKLREYDGALKIYVTGYGDQKSFAPDYD